MDFQLLVKKTKLIRKLFSKYEIKQFGKEWTREQILMGFVGDVGDLVKLCMAQDNLRIINNPNQKLAHELSDCLWAIIIIAQKYNIDLERSFLETMNDLEIKLKNNLHSSHV